MALTWEIESARLSIFASSIDALNLASWAQVTGATPQQVATRPGDKASHQEIGVHHGSLIVITRSSARADLVLQAAPGSSPGTVRQHSDQLVKYAKSWLHVQHDLQRVAVGFLMSVPAADEIAALDLLLKQVPSFDRKGATITDFLLQLNRPRKSAVDRAIDINRLAKWSTVQIQTVQMTAGGMASVGSAGGLQHRAQLELDVNTNISVTSIKATQVVPLIEELAEFCAESAEKGDVP